MLSLLPFAAQALSLSLRAATVSTQPKLRRKANVWSSWREACARYIANTIRICEGNCRYYQCWMAGPPLSRHQRNARWNDAAQLARWL